MRRHVALATFGAERAVQRGAAIQATPRSWQFAHALTLLSDNGLAIEHDHLVAIVGRDPQAAAIARQRLLASTDHLAVPGRDGFQHALPTPGRREDQAVRYRVPGAIANDDVAIVLQPAGLIDALILDRYGIAGYREGDGCALKLVRGVPPGLGNVGDPPAVERMRYRRRSRSDRRHGVHVGLQFRPAGESILLRQRVLRIRQLRGRVYT